MLPTFMGPELMPTPMWISGQPRLRQVELTSSRHATMSQCRLHRMRACASSASGAPQNAITASPHVLVDRARWPLDHAGDRCQELVHELRQRARIELSEIVVKPAHVGEEHAHHAALAGERQVGLGGLELLHDLGRPRTGRTAGRGRRFRCDSKKKP